MNDKKRVLSFNEMMLLSKVFDEIGIRSYVNEIGNIDIDNRDNLIKITLDAIGYLISKMYLSQETLSQLITSYTKITDINNIDGDTVVETIMDMFSEGLPKVLKKIIAIDDFKKKMIPKTVQQ